MIEKLKEKKLSFYFHILSAILSAIAFFYVANVGNKMPLYYPEEYKASMIFIIVGVIVEIITIVFFGKRIHGYLALICSICLSIALVSFMFGSVMSVIDYIYKIVMWGDGKQFSAIITNGILLFLGAGLSVASCWLD